MASNTTTTTAAAAAASPAQGKTVIVTGGAGGLGHAIASAFLAAGARVAVCDVHAARLAEAEAGWRAAHSGPKSEDGGEEPPFLTSVVDVTSEAAVADFVAAAAERLGGGRVDVLVNNAGVMDTFDPVGTTARDTWDRVLGVNLTGAFLCTKAAVNTFLAQTPPGGTVISIASVAATRGTHAGAAYTASKHGLLGLARNTAGVYGGRGISSIVLVLGGMDDTHIADAFASGFSAEGIAAMQANSAAYVPGKTNVALADVAKYCLFLADPAVAAASNGAAITVNKNWPAA
ncbi:hypothetical protein GGR56DRAFT_658164 [Xylariaceae sp. FL0804]|nr:hypothetical protein GGR56DRAFT_658164 [Xylariaceae sp. FL0804]